MFGRSKGTLFRVSRSGSRMTFRVADKDAPAVRAGIAALRGGQDLSIESWETASVPAFAVPQKATKPAAAVEAVARHFRLV